MAIALGIGLPSLTVRTVHPVPACHRVPGRPSEAYRTRAFVSTRSAGDSVRGCDSSQLTIAGNIAVRINTRIAFIHSPPYTRRVYVQQAGLCQAVFVARLLSLVTYRAADVATYSVDLGAGTFRATSSNAVVPRLISGECSLKLSDSKKADNAAGESHSTMVSRDGATGVGPSDENSG